VHVPFYFNPYQYFHQGSRTPAKCLRNYSALFFSLDSLHCKTEGAPKVQHVLIENSSRWPFRTGLINMAEHHSNDTNDAHYPNENLENWQLPCEQCISRPPVFNADNCSCAEVAAHSRGCQHLSQSSFYEQPRFHYENTLPVYHQQPQSYASSSISVPSPEGPEREDPNKPPTNNFLPLGPEAGLNETQHRRSASFHSDLSYQMRRFLVEQEEHQHPAPYATERAPAESGFLPQDIYIQSQAPGKGKKGKLSYMSASTSSGDASFFSWNVDPVTGSGAWVDAEGNLYEYAGNSYPMVVSGEFIYDDTMN
jgi:hypothetical protein